MATCMDCLHYDVCIDYTDLKHSKFVQEFNGAHILCKHFKDKSQYTEVKRGEWELYADNEDGYDHHRCSVCKEDAIFTYIEEPDYDEGLDGEWYYVCDREVGIEETCTDYCPHCGTKMDGGKE